MRLSARQKFKAIQALAHVNISHRERFGDIIALPAYLEVKKGCILSCVYGVGDTKEQAINDLWEQLTDLPEGECLGLFTNGRRRYFVWDEFFWREV